MKFTTSIVALDMTKIDEQLIQAARFANRYFGSNRIYFVHATPPVLLSPVLKKELEHLYNNSLSTQIRTKLEEEIEPLFPVSSPARVTILTEEGEPYTELKYWVEEKRPQLLIVGKKKKTEHSGITAKRIARIADTSVWFIPEEPKFQITKVLIPIDYSQYSMKALRTAIDLKRKQTHIDIIPCVVFDIPLPEAAMADYREEYKRKQIAYHKKEYQTALDKYHIEDDTLNPLFLFENKLFSISKSIRNAAAVIEADMIIMGAKGHAALTSILLGSVAESLVTQEDEISILIVR